MTKTVTLKVSPDAVTKLRNLALRSSADQLRRIGLSETLLAVCIIAEQHYDEVREALTIAEKESEE